MKRFVLPLIIVLAFLLRVPLLDKYPVGFTPDEASFGYDAYSIFKNGRDQWGTPAPIVLKSFGDYKSPLYSYFTIPSITAFGLNKYAVRLPNAILGVMAVLVVYLLSNQMFDKKFGILPAFLLAISPWHIMLSRGAFEANLITLFVPLGIYFFLVKKYELSSIVFGLSLFTYHSTKLITPIIFLTLLLTLRIKKVIPIILFSLFFLLMLYANSLGGGKRIAERSITAGALEEGARTKIELIQAGENPIVARLLHNKYQVVATRFLTNYSQYFSMRFLVTDGPAETSYGMLPGLGVLTYLEIIGIVALIFLKRRVKWRREILLLIIWLLVAPLPAALSTGVGYAGNRAAGMMPIVQIVAAIGIFYLWQSFNQTKYLLIFLGAFGLGMFLNKYLIESPTLAAGGMLEGRLEMAKTAIAESEGKQEVVIPKSWSEPHIFIAFVGKYDPVLYQAETINWDLDKHNVSWVDQLPEYRLGKYIFK